MLKMEEIITDHLENTAHSKLNIFLGGAFMVILLTVLFFWGLPAMQNTGQNLSQTYKSYSK